MGRSDYFAGGQWNFFCDFCGAKEKSSNGERTWNGYYVCRHHREERNPQDFVRGIKDNQSVPWTRPESVDVFVPTEYDRFFSEALPLVEVLVFKLSKNIGKLVGGGINYKAINGGAINGPGGILSDPRESLPYAEAIAFSVTKPFAEALPITETFSVVKLGLRSVNGAPLNKYALG